jgi:ParB-like chromosome segregation protein Spo0J
VALITRKPQEPNEAIENVDPTTLSLHPENPRQGDVGAIVTSIEKNGWFGTLVAQRKTRQVLAGNHRLQAAIALEMDSVPVYWVDVDESEAKRILLADNRTSDLATWDDTILVTLLEALATNDELLGSGYDGDDLDALLYEAQLNETGLGNLLNDNPTPEERATAVEAAGIRSIIIPYELEEYNTVVSQLAEARNTLKVDTNAQVLSTLLRDKL